MSSSFAVRKPSVRSGPQLFEAHKAQSEQEFRKLNGARTDMPARDYGCRLREKAAESSEVPDVYPVAEPSGAGLVWQSQVTMSRKGLL